MKQLYEFSRHEIEWWSETDIGQNGVFSGCFKFFSALLKILSSVSIDLTENTGEVALKEPKIKIKPK